MFGFLKAKQDQAPRAPDGWRGYAVGDIHGRVDLLDRLLADIERDNEARGPRRTLLVFLGDLIDRGPNSNEVVERLRTYRRPGIETAFIAGNHEEVLLRLLAGERGLMRHWLKFGGGECLHSYGLDPVALDLLGETKALAQLREAFPSHHENFLAGFADTVRFGDYLFVHAGIRPMVDLSLQRQSDLRWIRDPFLSDQGDHGVMVVHGHTISDRIVERPNRIGIDTGAYRTGVLSAIGLEGASRWHLDTGQAAAADPAAARETSAVSVN